MLVHEVWLYETNYVNKVTVSRCISVHKSRENALAYVITLEEMYNKYNNNLHATTVTMKTVRIDDDQDENTRLLSKC